MSSSTHQDSVWVPAYGKVDRQYRVEQALPGCSSCSSLHTGAEAICLHCSPPSLLTARAVSSASRSAGCLRIQRTLQSSCCLGKQLLDLFVEEGVGGVSAAARQGHTLQAGVIS